MPNPERLPEQNNTKSAELSGSVLRQINQVRGEKTYESERIERDKETLENIAKLRQKLEDIHKEKIELGIISSDTPFVLRAEDYISVASAPEPPVAPAPEPTVAQSPESSAAQSPQTFIAPESPTSPTQKNTEPAPVEPEDGAPNTPPTTFVPTQASGDGTMANSENDPQQAEKNGTKEKIKKKLGLKKVLTGVAATVLASLVITGAWLGFSSLNKDKTQEPNPQSATESVDSTDTIGENQEANGIYDGYGEKGMWLSKNKGGTYDFASAKEVAEVCDNDERKMVEYAAKNQVENFADYLANLPEALQPEGFKGLTILETERKLESLSKEDFDAKLQYFNNIMDNASIRRVIINGEVDNAYMRLKDSSKGATHENMELVACTTNEQNLEVTEFYWQDDDGREIGSMVVKMQPIYNEDGNILGYRLCLQVISQKGRSIYKGMEQIPSDPSTGQPSEVPTEVPSEVSTEPSSTAPTEPSSETPTEPSTETPSETPTEPSSETPSETPTEPSTETPSETPTEPSTETPSETPTEPSTETPTEPSTQPPTDKPAPKNTDAEKQNAGSRVNQQPLNEAVTPKTTLEEDKANFAQIKKQQEEDAARAAEAKRIAAEQAERQRQAAEEARELQSKLERASIYYEAVGDTEAQRRADEAAARAASDALSADQIAAEIEAAVERAGREEAQNEAEAAAETMSSGAEEMGTYNLDERADLYEQLFGGQ